MADYHMSASTFSRGRGQSATAAAAYRASAQIVDQTTGDLHDYTRKSGTVVSEIVLPKDAPDWAGDREALWSGAEASETRKNATVAREFCVGLPAELDADQRHQLAIDYARELVDNHGFAADVAIHQPSRNGDERNYHAHILCSTRRLDTDGFTQKTRELDDRQTGPEIITKHRERWATLANAALENAGIDDRIDHRTLAAQGIDREPTQHMGPAATAIERREPGSTRIGRENRERKQQNAERSAELYEIETAERAEIAADDLARDEIKREIAQEIAQAHQEPEPVAERLREQARAIAQQQPAPEPEPDPAPEPVPPSLAPEPIASKQIQRSALAERMKERQRQEQEREEARQALMIEHDEPVILDEVIEDDGRWQWEPIDADQLTHQQQCALEDARDELAEMKQSGPRPG